MKAGEIKLGGVYLAKVGGVTVKVKVNRIRETHGGTTAYDVVNTATGAKTIFYSAAKFRSEVPATEICDVCGGYIKRLQPGGCTCPENDKPFEEQADNLGFDQYGGPVKEDEQSLPPIQDATLTSDASTATSGEDPAHTVMDTMAASTPVQNADTTGATEAVQTSDQTEEGEQSPFPTTDVQSVMETPLATTSALTTAPASSLLASRIAKANQRRQQDTPIAGMVPNEEQESILAVAVERGLKVLVVGAGAGTGKTATLKMLEQVLPGRGQYTAFNSALVTESKAKFTKCAVNTTHSLAFRAVGRQFAHRLPGNPGVERMKSSQVARILGIQPFSVILKGQGAPDESGKPTDKVKVLQDFFLAGQVMLALSKFQQSADLEIDKQHFHYIDGIDHPEDGKRTWGNNNAVRKYLLPFAQKMWEDLSRVDGVLPFSHDVYVKLWQLGQGDDRPIIASDYILLDEAQDTAPVFLDILKRQAHALLVLVGDDNQQIYEWRGAVNAMASFPGAPRRLLSQSYRFGQAVADVANAVLAELDEPTDLVMRGNPSLPSRVGVVIEPRCYLYRTNAGAISRVMIGIEEGKRPHLIFGSEAAKHQLISFFNGVLDLQAKPPRKTTNSELACFEDWEEVEEYASTDEGADLKLMVKLVNEFGAAEIRDALKNMPKEEDADFVCSTAHRSKGREWDTVKLGPDFPLANKMTDADRRLLYVAATRAKLTLDISECPPFCGGNDTFDTGNPEKSGAWVSGLTIRYTKPMPTEEEQLEWLKAKQASAEKPFTSRPVASETPVGGLPIQPTSPASNAIVNDSEVCPAVGGIAYSTVVNGTFTWTKFNDKWLIRGQPNVQVGARVKVTRKDGSSAEVVIKEVVKRFNDAWIYGT